MTFIDFISKQLQTKKNRSMKQNEQMSSNPSIIKSSELSRCLSKKTVTFASVFDIQDETERTDDLLTFDLAGNDESPLREDQEELGTIILNKYNEDEDETNVNSEPYPFRSETALSTLIDGKSSFMPSSPLSRRHSSRKLRKNFLRSRPAKKLRHPVKTLNSIGTNHRSTSAPDLFVPTANKSNPAPLKTVRQWFKCSSLGRFVRTLTKTNLKSENQLPIESIPSTTQSKQRRRKYSDLIY